VTAVSPRTVVGARPVGLLRHRSVVEGTGFEVDLLDALPAPFGLVRAGVAPDDPKARCRVTYWRRARLGATRGGSSGCLG
jgi:ferredoxin--NADP+ reductase